MKTNLKKSFSTGIFGMEYNDEDLDVPLLSKLLVQGVAKPLRPLVQL